tara:strand:- start:3956 stop:4933 length:978 start_codon:yes stop_codon:yes gene_type:complete
MNECKLILVLITVIFIVGCQREEIPDLDTPGIRLFSKVTPSQPKPGEAFIYSISIDYDKNLYKNQKLPPQLGSQIEGISVIADRLSKIEQVGSRIYRSRDYELRAELAGVYILPEAVLKTAEGNELKSGKIYLEISSEEQGLGEQDILDIDPLLDQTFERNYSGYLWLLSACILLGLVLFIYRRATRDELLEVPLEPWEWVESELERHNLGKLVEQEQFRDFYDAWSGICRGYFNRRFGLNAEESTLEELLPSLRSIDLPEKIQRELQGFFPEADLARYADVYRGQNRLEAALSVLKDLVEQTTHKTSENDQYENFEEGDEIARN